MTTVPNVFHRRVLPALPAMLATILITATPARAQETPEPKKKKDEAEQAAGRSATAQSSEFWVVFQKNFRDYAVSNETQVPVRTKPLSLALFLSSDQPANGVVSVPGIRFQKEFSIAAGGMTVVTVDTAAQLRSDEKVERLAAHITANVPVTVFGLSHRYQTTDTYNALPVSALGTRYRVMCYSWLENDLLAQFAVIGTQDSTRVRITPSVVTQSGKPARVPFVILLNRGETYQVMPRFDPAASSDLTGSLIESDKSVAVFSGHNCAYVPDLRTKACNHLVEQMPPMESWGTEYHLMGTFATRISGSTLRVLAGQDGTSIFMNGRSVATLNAGAFYEEKNLTETTVVTASNPVLAALFSKGFDGDSVGDPMMIVLTPRSHYRTEYQFGTPMQGPWRHFVCVAVATPALASLRLDGQPVDYRQFSQTGAGFSIGALQIPYGPHHLLCAEPFGVYSYGFGYGEGAFDAYGNGQ